MVRDIRGGKLSSSPNGVLVHDGTLYFSATRSDVDASVVALGWHVGRHDDSVFRVGLAPKQKRPAQSLRSFESEDLLDCRNCWWEREGLPGDRPSDSPAGGRGAGGQVGLRRPDPQLNFVIGATMLGPQTSRDPKY